MQIYLSFYRYKGWVRYNSTRKKSPIDKAKNN